MHKLHQSEQFAREVDALNSANLRPTRQRVQLLHLLVAEGDRHVTAEALHAEARTAEISVSLATVYNTLNQFTECGLLKRLAIDPGKTYFDTNTSDHHHFYDQSRQTLIDVPLGDIRHTQLPAPPKGTKVQTVEIVVRIS